MVVFLHLLGDPHLEQNHLRLGMKREEVLELLVKESKQKEQTLRYYLGLCVLALDGSELVLEFDADGELAKIYELQF